MDVVARDIDDWMFHFERQVGTRLKELFGVNLETLPPALALRLQKLRDATPQVNDRDTGDEPSRER